MLRKPIVKPLVLFLYSDATAAILFLISGKRNTNQNPLQQSFSLLLRPAGHTPGNPLITGIVNLFIGHNILSIYYI